MEDVWVVGTHKGESELGKAWEFQGVFSTRERAEAVCEGHPNWFIGPVRIDEELPVETVKWPRCYYPCSETYSESTSSG